MLGGVLVLLMGPEISWKLKILLVLIPAMAYALMLFPLKFHVNERIKAGVSYIDMLKEAGIGGALIIIALIVFQLGAVFGWSITANALITVGITAVFGFLCAQYRSALIYHSPPDHAAARNYGAGYG